MRFSLNFKSLALLLILGLLGVIPVHASSVVVEYDSQKNKIAIQATNASLTSVLAEIANKTNMTIQIDPAVEKQVSFQLRPQSLQQALQKVVKGMSYVIEYSIDEKQQTVISGMKLLPKGKQDSGQLVPVSVLNARASRIGRGDGSGDQSKNPVVEQYETRPLLSEEESALQGRTISSIRRKKPEEKSNPIKPISRSQDDDKVTRGRRSPAEELSRQK